MGNTQYTAQSHEPEFDYLKSLEIEEKINQIKWLRRKNQAHFLLSTNGMCHVKKISEKLFCELHKTFLYKMATLTHYAMCISLLPVLIA